MPYQNLDPNAVHELLAADPSTVFIDVRSPQEFEQGHVPGAYNVPIAFMTPAGMQPNPGFVAAVTRRFPKTQKIVFGCKSGGRSARACEFVQQQGYTQLVNLAGGFHGASDMSGSIVQPGWLQCGLDSTKKSEPGRSWRELEAAAVK